MNEMRYRLERFRPGGKVDVRYRATREAADALVERWERETPGAEIRVLFELLRITGAGGDRRRTGSLHLAPHAELIGGKE
ncbi:MAG: hypothetical protein OXE57_18875 [Alphaproteobacteria bacterium]|nr:hypothetical protein [Alphaproteobacteria bacterium]